MYMRLKYIFIGTLAGMLVMAGAVYALASMGALINHGHDSKIQEILYLLDRYSINPYEKDELVEHMYRGLVGGVGDPYTYYYDLSELEAFNIQTEGVYAGVGMQVNVGEDGLVTIVLVYPDTPAYNAGLLPGDKIIAIDGFDATVFDKLDEVTSKTKGEPGTEVVLTILRPSEDMEFDASITRQIINIPTISHRLLDHMLGYIKIDQFDRTTFDQFTNAYYELSDMGALGGLVIDVRNNPGGLLDSVIDIANFLLPEGVITYMEDKSGERQYHNSDEEFVDLPMVFIVNEHSASASEVLAGAARDLIGSPLVGRQTFGKGSVQNLYELADGSAVKITVSKYFTPNGISIQGEGLLPDYIVPVAEDGDAGLDKAVEVLLGMING